jgi:tRNA (adenine57-N1/adenine58-N1)-methyltransferase
LFNLSNKFNIGTGSASLSHSLIRAIRPSGHLYTFDFHEQRVLLAQEEFKNHGIDEFVTVKHRDVCTEGFGNELDNKIDAVFLDLPHPWLTIDFAIKSFKNKGTIFFYYFSFYFYSKFIYSAY